MDDNRIFRAIWRFNAVALAIGIVLVTIVSLVAVSDIAASMLWREARNVAAPVDAGNQDNSESLQLSLGRFSWLQDKRILWAPVFGAQTFQYRISSKKASSIRNYVFLDTKTGASHELLPNNRVLIANTEVIRTRGDDNVERPRAVAFGLVESDTNADGRLTANDKVVIAMVGVDGRRLVRLPHQGRLLSAQSVDQQTGLLVFEAATDNVQAVTIDLDTFKVVRRFPVWGNAQ